MSPEVAEEMSYFDSIFTVRMQEILWRVVPLHDGYGQENGRPHKVSAGAVLLVH